MGARSSRRQWLRESETIVNKDHKLLFCAPPNTGSLQFRMLAKRIKVRFLRSVWAVEVRTGSTGERGSSDHLLCDYCMYVQLIKFWRSCSPV